MFLETEGIHVKSNSKSIHIKFRLVLLQGDNLGIHSLLGFSESFNSNYPCRFCKVSKDHLQTLFYQDDILMRTIENYESDVLLNDISKTGIKESCIFNSLKNFHVTKNFSVDLMHDLLEGVCHYDIILILNYLIRDKKYFSLDTINYMLQVFNYGEGFGNKPPLISADFYKKSKLQMSASEMLCFIRIFGVLIGDQVPVNDVVWQFFFLLLRQIIDICTAHSVSENVINLLKWLIAEHNSEFINLFKQPLKPKFHYLIHYPYIMSKIGPIRNLWSMRYESKHRDSKMTANVSCSRKNITKTLATKHQLKLSYRLLIDSFMQSEIINGATDLLPDQYLAENYSNLTISTRKETNYFHTKWVIINNIKYKPSCVLELQPENLDSMERLFGQIIEVLLDSEGNIYFIFEYLYVVEYSEHLYAFLIKKKMEYFLLYLISNC